MNNTTNNITNNITNIYIRSFGDKDLDHLKNEPLHFGGNPKQLQLVKSPTST
jgi:hypothetical protein